MSEFKTLAYDLYKLRGTYKPMYLENLSNEPPKSLPTVTIHREKFIAWSDNYKVLIEFATEVLQKPDFTTWDLVKWYQDRAHELEDKARKTWYGDEDGKS